ncbi:Ankyrin repeat [Diplonema papillatum]|nr:Ankyrin repeat [Diplonema papillatum]
MARSNTQPLVAVAAAVAAGVVARYCVQQWRQKRLGAGKPVTPSGGRPLGKRKSVRFTLAADADEKKQPPPPLQPDPPPAAHPAHHQDTPYGGLQRRGAPQKPPCCGGSKAPGNPPLGGSNSNGNVNSSSSSSSSVVAAPPTMADARLAVQPGGDLRVLSGFLRQFPAGAGAAGAPPCSNSARSGQPGAVERPSAAGETPCDGSPPAEPTAAAKRVVTSEESPCNGSTRTGQTAAVAGSVTAREIPSNGSTRAEQTEAVACAVAPGDQSTCGQAAGCSTLPPPAALVELLHRAAACDRADAVRLLLQGARVGPDAAVGGKRAVHVAAERKRPGCAVLRALLEAGADPNAADDSNSRITALHLACAQGHEEAVSILLKTPGILPRRKNTYDWQAAHLAAATNRAGILAMLHEEHGIDVNCTNNRGSTPLHLSCTAQAHAASRWLLQHGADCTVADCDGNTPLHLLMLSAQKSPVLHELLDAVLRVGADVAAANGRGRTPLHNALTRGHGKLSAVLLSRGAPVDAADEQGVTPVHQAASCGDAAMLTLLLETRPTGAAGMPDSKGRTPLAVTAANGHKECVELLLARGAPIDSVDSVGNTPLLTALRNERKKAALALAQHGADGSVADQSGNTPLALAAHLGVEYSSLAELLIAKQKVDVGCTDQEGRTPLHWAAATGNSSLCTILLEAGADCAAVTTDGVTPLHWAAGEGELDTTEIMVIEGQSRQVPSWVNCRDSSGRTPLHWALRHTDRVASYVRVCELLLENGADILATDNEGNSYTAALSDDVLSKLYKAISRGEAKV